MMGREALGEVPIKSLESMGKWMDVTCSHTAGGMVPTALGCFVA